MNNGILNKLVMSFRNLPVLKKILIAAVIILFLILIPSVILLSKNNPPVIQKPLDKTWEIITTFNINSDKLSLKKISLLDKKIAQDNRSADFSSYELVMYNSSGEAIYRTKINITTQLLYDMSIEAPASGSANTPELENLETVLYVPFLDKGTVIVIKKDNEDILKIDLPKETGFSFPGIPKAYAQPAAQSCDPLVVAFISDGYTDFDQFHRDVEAFKGVYFSTPPFDSASIFDFRAIDNSQSLGCKSTNSLKCINSSGIIQIAKAAEPEASKVIVLVNMPPPGGALGVTNGIGGNMAVFPTIPSGTITLDKIKLVGAHEFLGHAVGQLYDRYVSAELDYSIIESNMPRSNCTDNPSGEGFWSGAGGVGIYQGCGNKNNYGSSPLTCASQNPKLISGGTLDTTMMSAVGCAKSIIFDSVEQDWIKTQIIPLYCGGTSGGGTTTTTTTAPLASALPLLKGVVYIDTNGNNNQDSGEIGYQGATINITGPFSGSATTDSQGNYSFPNLPVGDYTVSFTAGSIQQTINTPIAIQANMTRELKISIPPDAVTTTTTDAGSVTTTTISSGGTGTGTRCGDGFCDQGETSRSCPADCRPAGFPLTTTTTIRYTTANCVFDPNCITNGNQIQVCALKCTVK
jgi:hypothetical protein